jgi:glycosyltransferase involved in cell wall biosynthesis
VNERPDAGFENATPQGRPPAPHPFGAAGGGGGKLATVRICYVNPAGAALFDHTYVSHQPYGGAEVALAEQARALTADPAFDVHMIVNHHRDGKFESGGITVHTIGGTYADQALHPFAAYRVAYCRALAAVDADLYVQRGVPADLYFLAACACALRHKRYVQVLALAPVRGIRPTQVRRYLRWIVLEQASLRLASAVVALAHDQVASLPASVKRKTQVIREGKRLAELPDRERTYVLWTGRPHPSKRPELFVELARALPRERFVMAVAGTGDIAPRGAALPPNLTIERNVPHASMNALYAGAKVLVHTSVQEGFANVFIEAWQNGTPVISLGVDTDGLIRRLGLGRPVTTSSDLVRAVTELLADTTAWRACSSRARTYVRQHHDLVKQMDRYKQLFLGLCRGLPSAGVGPSLEVEGQAEAEGEPPSTLPLPGETGV